MVRIDDRAFQEGYRALLARIQQEARKAITRYAEAARAAMITHIHSESGELADHIVVEEHLDANPPYVVVGSEETGAEPHGLYVEFGTVHMAPRPFARPGLLEAEADYYIEP